MINLQEEERRQRLQAAWERNPGDPSLERQLAEQPEPVKLLEIRRIDEWRIEWGFAPYERAVQLFREDFQGRTSPFPVKDVASVYKNMAAMAKEDGRSRRS